MTNPRLARIHEAVRPAMKARLMLAGPAGAGKTHTALTIAQVLVPDCKPLVIDTEEESALTYADKFSFVHLPWEPPFDPAELADVVADVAKDYPVVIIDSASHFWSDEGGTLDIAAGRFTGWKAARPKQRDMIVSVLRAPTHMIVCVRSKMEYAQEEKNGKQVVTKLGMAPVQDSTFEFEMNVSAEIDMQHKVAIGKTRCDVLDGREFAAGHAEDMARIYRDWLQGGEPVADAATVSDLVSRMNAIADEDRRKEAKREFVSRFGRPEHLAATKVTSAREFVAAREGGNGGSPEGKGADTSTSVTDDQPAGPVAIADPPAPSPADDDRHRKRVNAVMGEAGVKDDTERHALIRYATAGAATSSRGLTAEQVAAVVVAAGQVTGGELVAMHALDGTVTFAATEPTVA